VTYQVVEIEPVKVGKQLLAWAVERGGRAEAVFATYNAASVYAMRLNKWMRENLNGRS